MQNRCCAIGCFLNNSRKAHAHQLATLMILRNFISLRAFTVYMENSLRFEISLRSIDRSEICTEVSFTMPEVMWTLIMKLPHTEVKFYPEVKSQTGLNSLRVSCKHDQRKSLVMCTTQLAGDALLKVQNTESRLVYSNKFSSS